MLAAVLIVTVAIATVVRSFPLMFIRIVSSLVVLLGAQLLSPASALALGTAEQSCYAVLQQQLDTLPHTDAYLAAAPADLAARASDAITLTSSHDFFTQLGFDHDLFSKRIYNFGPEYGFTVLDAFPSVAARSPNFTDYTYTQFAVDLVYDIDSDDFLYCMATEFSPADERTSLASISTANIGMITPPNIIGEQVYYQEYAGTSYQVATTKTSIMYADYTQPYLDSYHVVVVPEASRTDFDLYQLVAEFVDQVNAFHTVYLPQTQAWLEENNITTESIGSWYGGAIERERAATAYFINSPVLFNGGLNNLDNYTPWIRYFMAQDMLSLGQTDVTDMKFTYFNSNNTENRTFIDYLSNLATQTVAYNKTIGIAEPNKADNTQLFYRIQKQLEAGADDADLKEYIAAYPSYLDDFETAKARMQAAEDLETMSDIDLEAWYVGFIYDLMSWGAMSGYDDGTFRPADQTNRAELAKIVTIIFDLKLPYSIDSNPFSDVPADAWYTPFVAATKDAGVVGGYPDGTFHPSQSVNRAEAMKMIISAAESSDLSTDKQYFADVVPTAWYTPFVNFALEHGIAGGYGDGTFRPGQPVTRAEIAKMAAQARWILRGE